MESPKVTVTLVDQKPTATEKSSPEKVDYESVSYKGGELHNISDFSPKEKEIEKEEDSGEDDELTNMKEFSPEEQSDIHDGSELTTLDDFLSENPSIKPDGSLTEQNVTVPEQSGGMEQDMFDKLTEDFSLSDATHYVKTDEYLNFIHGDDYSDYLKEYENFYKEQLLKSNLSKYNYSEKKNILEKKSAKTTLSIRLPLYENINVILDHIQTKINDKEYELKKIRDILLLNPDSKLSNDFTNIKSSYITLLKQKEIYTTYLSRLNNIEELHTQKITLLEKRREVKLKLYAIYYEIKRLLKESNNKDGVEKLANEYIELNTIVSIDKELRNISDKLLSISKIIILQPPSISKNKPLPKSKLENPIIKEVTIEESPDKEPKIPKTKLKIKKKKLVVKPTEDPKDSTIEAGVIDGNQKKRTRITKKPVVAGKCVFPFKHGKKYIKEEDGCIKTKDGEWCATSVEKDPDYEWKTLGFCEKQD